MSLSANFKICTSSWSVLIYFFIWILFPTFYVPGSFWLVWDINIPINNQELCSGTVKYLKKVWSFWICF